MNASELVVKEELERRGFAVYRNGWPDFLAVRKTRNGANECLGVMGVEVKNGSDRLSESQTVIHRILRQARIPVHVVSTQSVVDLKPSSRSLLTTGDVREARLAAKSIAQEIDRLQQRLDSLSKAVDGTHCFLDTVGPLLTFDDFEMRGEG